MVSPAHSEEAHAFLIPVNTLCDASGPPNIFISFPGTVLWSQVVVPTCSPSRFQHFWPFSYRDRAVLM